GLREGEGGRLLQYVLSRHHDERRATAVPVLAENSVAPAVMVAPIEAGLADAAAHAGLEDDFVAGLDLRGAVPGGSHHTGHIAPWNEGQWIADPGNAAPNPEIEVVQRDRAHLDENFIGRGDRIGAFFEPERLDAAVFADDHRLHADSRSSIA